MSHQNIWWDREELAHEFDQTRCFDNVKWPRFCVVFIFYLTLLETRNLLGALLSSIPDFLFYILYFFYSLDLFVEKTKELCSKQFTIATVIIKYFLWFVDGLLKLKKKRYFLWFEFIARWSYLFTGNHILPSWSFDMLCNFC